jgi:hypothetical protein
MSRTPRMSSVSRKAALSAATMRHMVAGFTYQRYVSRGATSDGPHIGSFALSLSAADPGERSRSQRGM